MRMLLEPQIPRSIRRTVFLLFSEMRSFFRKTQTNGTITAERMSAVQVVGTSGPRALIISDMAENQPEASSTMSTPSKGVLEPVIR